MSKPDGYALIIEHQCDEELTLVIARRSNLGPHAIPVDLTDDEAAEFRKTREAWHAWQDRLTDAYDSYGDVIRCEACSGTGVRPDVQT